MEVMQWWWSIENIAGEVRKHGSAQGAEGMTRCHCMWGYRGNTTDCWWILIIN